MCNAHDINSNKNNKASKIENFLIGNKNVCLSILGNWGVGKTYLWKEVEKEIENKNKKKKIVYIDLFGKESYKQILEEIVLKVNGSHNDIIAKATKVSSNILKLTTGVNINLDSIFSTLKKEDFENIIVCFDNIERKSDKLPLDEILGLVNLLKEDKSCNVVMILNKDELTKKQNMQNNSKEPSNSPTKSVEKEKMDSSWYEIYKEKVIDYEIIIENNEEIAREIIKNELKCNIKEIEQDIVEIILNYFKQKLNNNLRLLIKITRHIKYFNEECFMQFYNHKDYESFMSTLVTYYESLFNEVMQYYSINPNNKNEETFIYYKKYLDNLLHLSKEDIKKVCDAFQKELKDIMPILKKYKQEYIHSNLDDNQIAEYIEELLPKIENYPFCNETFYYISYYDFFIELYRDIKGKDLPCKEKIMKQFIKILVSEEKESNPHLQRARVGLKGYFESIEDMIRDNPKYREYYEQLKEDNNSKENIKNFVNNYPIENIKNSFNARNIKKYNNFKQDDIVDIFRENRQFYEEFFWYFSNLVDAESNYDLSNNLFQAYKLFLNANDNRIKQNKIKEILNNNQDCLLYKLLYKT